MGKRAIGVVLGGAGVRAGEELRRGTGEGEGRGRVGSALGNQNLGSVLAVAPALLLDEVEERCDVCVRSAGPEWVAGVRQPAAVVVGVEVHRHVRSIHGEDVVADRVQLLGHGGLARLLPEPVPIRERLGRVELAAVR